MLDEMDSAVLHTLIDLIVQHTRADISLSTP